VPPPPPSAYGLVVPGAAEAPQLSPPPPPSFSPPLPDAPQAPYTPPSDLSGFFGGPTQAGPSAAGFGGVAPSPFGAPASQFGGAPPIQFGGPPAGAPYGAPPWASAPPSRSKRLWVSLAVGAVAVLVVGVGGLRVYDRMTMHHVGTMPAALQDTILDDGAQSQAIIAAAVASAARDHDMSRLKHFQVGIFRSGSTVVVADMGDIPSGSRVFRDALLNGAGSSAVGMTLTSVTPGHQGGSESCGAGAASAMCVWLDNGTVGFVFVNAPDVTAAQSYLQTLRDAVEH
jgi:hypothetical protein